MSDKKKRVYNALVEGATEGLSDKALFDFVQKKVPKVSSKKIVRASLLALSDADIKDANILHTIYALAIKQRLDPGHDHDDDDDLPVVEATPEPAPASPRRAKAKTTKPVIQPDAG